MRPDRINSQHTGGPRRGEPQRGDYARWDNTSVSEQPRLSRFGSLIATVERRTKRLLPFKPDAVFAASDAMAIGALRAIREKGLRVPDDIAIAGFDDMPFAAQADPLLTTVRQPISRAGSVAVETLIDLIAHPNPPRRIILPTELVIRASCGSGLHRQAFLAESLSQQDAV